MAPKLFLEGFTITPILSELHVKSKDLVKFAQEEAPKLLPEGFAITPIVRELDEVEETSALLQLAEHRVSVEDLVKFAQEDWPIMWQNLKALVKAQAEARAAQALGEAAQGSRPQRRRAARKGVVVPPVEATVTAIRKAPAKKTATKAGQPK